jgi:hypothetical protein
MSGNGCRNLTAQVVQGPQASITAVRATAGSVPGPRTRAYADEAGWYRSVDVVVSAQAREIGLVIEMLRRYLMTSDEE